jgi:glycine betaine catabolism A
MHLLWRKNAPRLEAQAPLKTASMVSLCTTERDRDSLPSSVRNLLDSQPPGHSLRQPFYSEPEIYLLDLERVWRKGWLFACHSCEIPRPGDYVSLTVDTDSIVVVRAEDGKPRALHNVCRHRGSLICEDECGHVRHLVCPYHRWTYALDGSLIHSPGMQEDLPKSELGLRQIALREVEGLIYISLAQEPLDFGLAHDVLGTVVRPQGFNRAKVAKAVDYLVKANWKLVWENNRECFHCNANHPQYIKANFDHYNADDTTPRIREQISAAVSRSEAKWAASGLAVSHKQTGMTTFPDAERNIWCSANRTTLVDGYVSETMDGKQVAPLMGDYADADVGTVRMRTLPNFWNHSSCDHGVSTRLLPLGPQLTAIRVWWLVAENAVEGRDYDLAKLMPFWQLTSEQDWEICERQQRGVNSSAYTPGPYSTYKEYNVNAFVRWYLKQLQTP